MNAPSVNLETTTTEATIPVATHPTALITVPDPSHQGADASLRRVSAGDVM